MPVDHGEALDGTAHDGLGARLARLATRIPRAAADLIVPPACVACRAPLAEHSGLCGACWRAVTFIHPPLCDRLGIPLPFDPDAGAVTPGEPRRPLLSARAMADPPVYARTRAVAIHDGVMRRLIHDLKYRDRHDARGLLGHWLAHAGHDLLAEADVVVPVPLARLRLLSRRFNQAALVALEASRLAGVAFDPLVLVKRRRTPPQVGLTQSERRRNVAGAFALEPRRAGRIVGRRIVLVDDVVTTGATVSACAQVLLKGGAAAVDVLALGLVADPAAVSA